MVRRLVEALKDLNTELSELDAQIESRFRQHEQAQVLTSLPGVGVLLGAEFVAVTGGDPASFGSPDRLAGGAGLAPVPRDSGRISGNPHRPRRYNRRLLPVFYISAQVSIQRCDASKTYYNRKRAEGKRHTQAVLALARRRVNVLWALLRDGRSYQPQPQCRPCKLNASQTSAVRRLVGSALRAVAVSCRRVAWGPMSQPRRRRSAGPR